MNRKKNLIEANIDNLTSLWKVAGIPFHACFSELHFDYCFIENSEWPNRLWLHQDLKQETISIIKERVASIPSQLTIPYFDLYNSNSNKFLESGGFTKQFEQVGMSLKLDNLLEVENDLSIQLVSNESESIVWSKLFERAFGYKIHHEILLKTHEEIDYYIAYHHDQVVGTAMAYKTNDVMGVHSVGIPPEMRRKGYANRIMKLLINLAIGNTCNHMVLQASEMGKNLYLKLGFQEDFIIKNYRTPQL